MYITTNYPNHPEAFVGASGSQSKHPYYEPFSNSEIWAKYYPLDNALWNCDDLTYFIRCIAI